MKKVIFMLMLSIASSLTITSCTEDNVQATKSDNGGGGPSEKDK